MHQSPIPVKAERVAVKLVLARPTVSPKIPSMGEWPSGQQLMRIVWW